MPESRVRGWWVAIAVAVVVVASSGVPTAAQTSGNGQGAAAQTIRTDWNERQLDAFAESVVAVAEVRSIWHLRIANAQTVEQAEEFRERMRAQIEEEISENGLTVKSYNRIFTAARADPRLYQDIRQRIEEAQQ